MNMKIDLHYSGTYRVTVFKYRIDWSNRRQKHFVLPLEILIEIPCEIEFSPVVSISERNSVVPHCRYLIFIFAYVHE